MAELLSVVETPADGSQTVFEFNFAGGYLSREHVKVIVFDGLDIDGRYLGGIVPQFSFLSDYTLSIPGPIPAGKIVRIYRDTPFNAPLVNFSDGSIVNEATLDRNAEQSIFAAAELRDRIGTPFDIDYFKVLQALTEADRDAVEAVADLIVPYIDANRANRPVNPCDAPYNATGNGTTSDTAAFLAALNSGRPVDGGGKTYAISGVLVPNPANFKGLTNCTLKWLTPASYPSGALLEIRGDVGGFTIDNVNFDIGSVTNTGANGDSDRNALRIWSSNPGTTKVAGFKVTNVTVWGDGHGTRIQIRGGTRFLVDKCIVRDGTASWVVDPTNDISNGLDFKYCTNFTFSNSIVDNLRSVQAGIPTIIHTRGFLFAECQDFLDLGNSVYKVGQGCDYSGAIVPTDPIGNRGFTKTGGEYVDCTFFGLKFANCARDGAVSSISVIRCGMIGVVCSSSNVTLSNPELNTQNIDFFGIKVVDMQGYNGYASQAFRVMENSNSPTWPRGIRFTACSAIDRQTVKKMINGFASDVTYDGSSMNFNQVNNVNVEGNTQQAVIGFAEYRVSLRPDSDQITVRGGETSLNFGIEIEDSMNMHSTTSNNNVIIVPFAGIWRVTATVRFEANGVGSRVLGLRKAGDKVSGAEVSTPALSFDQTQVSGVWLVDTVAGSGLSLYVYQNSDSDTLVTIAGGTRFSIELVKKL